MLAGLFEIGDVDSGVDESFGDCRMTWRGDRLLRVEAVFPVFIHRLFFCFRERLVSKGMRPRDVSLIQR